MRPNLWNRQPTSGVFCYCCLWLGKPLGEPASMASGSARTHNVTHGVTAHELILRFLLKFPTFALTKVRHGTLLVPREVMARNHKHLSIC